MGLKIGFFRRAQFEALKRKGSRHLDRHLERQLDRHLEERFVGHLKEQNILTKALLSDKYIDEGPFNYQIY